MAYVVTAAKGTSVSHSIKGAFTSPTDLNLLIGKSTRIEIHTFTNTGGLLPVCEIPINGSLAVMELWRGNKKSSAQLLFCVTTKYDYFVLKYDDKAKGVVTVTSGSMKEDWMPQNENKDTLAFMEPRGKLLGLHCYEGYYKVVPTDPKTGVVQEIFDCRLEELRVVQSVILYGETQPTLCILYDDFRGARHVKTYVIRMKERDLIEGPWAQTNVEAKANLIIPVSFGGVLIVGTQTIVYHNGGGTTNDAASINSKPSRSTTVRASTVSTQRPTASLIQAYETVDTDGSRYLLADHEGRLIVMVLKRSESDDSIVTGIELEELGVTSIASSVTYADNGVVFIGSAYGDSQLIKLHATKSADNSYVEVLENYTNIGPIVDFAVMDLDRQGQGQVVTCSGAHKDGSLRVIRNGIGLIEEAAMEIGGIKGMWSLRSSYESLYDTYLVQSFIGETRVLAMTGDEMEETEITGFVNEGENTLCCHTMVGDAWVQVTESQVRLVSSSSSTLLHSWTPPTTSPRITVATANATQVVVALVGGVVVYLNISENQKLVQVDSTSLDYEVSCLNINPVVEKLSSSLCAVGLWGTSDNISVHLLSLPGLAPLVTQALGGDTIPRSLLFCKFEAQPYLLVGMGDGILVTFVLESSESSNVALTCRKRVPLGSHPITLSNFRSRDISYVFAASDRPAVVYSTNHKVRYSNVNTNQEANVMTSFDSQSFPECLVLASDSCLTIGTIDGVQKLHIETYPLNEWPRRISHDAGSRTIAVCTISFIESEEVGFLRLLDNQTFEVLSSFQMDRFEFPCALISCSLESDNGEDSNNNSDDCKLYVVGTAYAHEEEPEPNSGRILVFTVTSSEGSADGKRRLTLLSERKVPGAVYCLEEFNGKLLAGINSKTQLFKWADKVDEGEKELVTECGHHGHILALFIRSHGDYIVVGDLMKSMALLHYDSLDGTLSEVSRDMNSNWLTAIEVLQDDLYLGAEADLNLFTVRYRSEAVSDEDRCQMQIHGQFHLGEFVNCFRKGSLVMSPTDPEPYLKGSSSLLFGSVNGTLGAIITLSPEQLQFLTRVQDAMRLVVKPVGGLSNASWRKFQNTRNNSLNGDENVASSFLDGDLIEAFLDLSFNDMEQVVKSMSTAETRSGDNDENNSNNPSVQELTVEYVTRRVEEMAQLH